MPCQHWRQLTALAKYDGRSYYSGLTVTPVIISRISAWGWNLRNKITVQVCTTISWFSSMISYHYDIINYSAEHYEIQVHCKLCWYVTYQFIPLWYHIFFQSASVTLDYDIVRYHSVLMYESRLWYHNVTVPWHDISYDIIYMILLLLL